MSKSTEVRWETPPPAHHHHGNGGGNSHKYDAVRKVLRERPGEWAVITEGHDATIANRLATYHRKSGRWVGYELTSRKGTIYARFVGDQ